MKELAETSTLILGYGREGRSVHRFIRERYPKIHLGIADKDTISPEAKDEVEIHAGESYLGSLADYDVIVRSPGISFFAPEVQEALKQGKKITSGTNIFFSECPGTIIGITGTKGKSTTSTLTYDLLKTTYPDTRLIGNIGRPVLDYLSGADGETMFVAELSSHQLEDARYSPQVAVILAIVPEHLSRHGSFEAYVEAKANIVRFQGVNDTVVLNPDNPTTAEIAERSAGHKLTYSATQTNVDCFVRDGEIFVEEHFVMPINEIPLLGYGNLENVLAAISVGRLFNVDLEKIIETIKKFKALPHRLEYVGDKNKVSFYNDSLATIPEATIHAMETLGSNVETLIAGGHDRGLDFSKLGEFLAGNNTLKNLILFPTTGERIWKAIKAFREDTKIQRFDVESMEEAIRIALANTNPGKICLLSPASASFGIFKNYEERGNSFRNLVTS